MFLLYYHFFSQINKQINRFLYFQTLRCVGVCVCVCVFGSCLSTVPVSNSLPPLSQWTTQTFSSWTKMMMTTQTQSCTSLSPSPAAPPSLSVYSTPWWARWVLRHAVFQNRFSTIIHFAAHIYHLLCLDAITESYSEFLKRESGEVSWTWRCCCAHWVTIACCCTGRNFRMRERGEKWVRLERWTWERGGIFFHFFGGHDSTVNNSVISHSLET